MCLTIIRLVFNRTKTLLSTHPIRPSRPSHVAYGLQWLVLAVILLGMFVSSFGSTVSHGIADVAMVGLESSMSDTQHDHALEHKHPHEHAYGVTDRDLSTAGDGALTEHPHHGADHSHDPAHTLIAAWTSIPPQLPAWLQHALTWNETMQLSRLERPPIG